MVYNFVVDSIHTLGGFLEATYAVHLRLIGRRKGYFLFVTNKHFSLGVMAEAIRVNID